MLCSLFRSVCGSFRGIPDLVAGLPGTTRGGVVCVLDAVLSFPGRQSIVCHGHPWADCINVVTNGAQCVLAYQITGGTGRFKNAFGTLELIETAVPELLDVGGNAIHFAASGVITGEVSGGSEEQDPCEGD